jgi:hypothetical protein
MCTFESVFDFVQGITAVARDKPTRMTGSLTEGSARKPL